MPLLDYLRFAPKLIWKRTSTPIYLTFFVTYKCNARCAHCFFWENLESNKEELGLAEIEKISKSMGNLLFLLISGGEPFLRKDLPQIIKFFYENNKVRNIAIPTNGILTGQIFGLTKQILQDCKKAHLVIDLSIDDIGEGHDKNRGVEGCFDKVMKTYEELNRLKSEYPNLNIGVALVLQQLNQERIKEIYEYLKNSLKLDSIALNLVRGTPKNIKLKDINIDYYDFLRREMNQDVLGQKLPGYSNFSLVELTIANNMLIRDYVSKTYRTPSYQMPCYAALLNAVLYPNGDVFACELLDKKMGNLKEANYDFRKVWSSPEAINLRKWIKDTKCFCTHECNLTTNILFNPRFLPQLLVRASQIKWRRLYHRMLSPRR